MNTKTNAAERNPAEGKPGRSIGTWPTRLWSMDYGLWTKRNALFSRRRGQAAIEFSVALVAMVILCVGITKVWAWMVSEIAMRQRNYEATRVLAATRREIGGLPGTARSLCDGAGNVTASEQVWYHTPEPLRMFSAETPAPPQRRPCP